MKHTRHRLNVSTLISQKLCTPLVMRAGSTRFSPRIPAQRRGTLRLQTLRRVHAPHWSPTQAAPAAQLCMQAHGTFWA